MNMLGDRIGDTALEGFESFCYTLHGDFVAESLYKDLRTLLDSKKNDENVIFIEMAGKNVNDNWLKSTV